MSTIYHALTRPPVSVDLSQIEKSQESLTKISDILQSVPDADVQEFLSTVQESHEFFKKVKQNNLQFEPSAMKEFFDGIRDYEALLEQLHNTGRLERYKAL